MCERESMDSHEGFDEFTAAAYEALETESNLAANEEYEEWLDSQYEDEHEPEYDGQPDEYTEWQDYMGGDDWDHGQYDNEY